MVAPQEGDRMMITDHILHIRTSHSTHKGIVYYNNRHIQFANVMTGIMEL